MYLKFATLFLAIAASVVNVKTAAVIARAANETEVIVTCNFTNQNGSSLLTGSCDVQPNELAQLSVILWDDVNFVGASFSPPITQGNCTTLPGDWLDRAESAQISSGFQCTFFTLQGCAGDSGTLSGNVGTLPMANPPLYNAVESLSCNKQV